MDWLIQTIENEKVDALLIAGDIFDTTTPSNRAQALYYQFLCRVAASCCRHVVVIAGNHDSPSFLNAPKDLLRALNVYVVGAITENLEDEVLVLRKDNQPEAIICAVPYLRDKDIRTVEPGETIDDKNTKLVEGLKAHYKAVTAIAENIRNNLRASAPSADKHIPIIAMGHLFTAGGETGDGVRELYVGSLAHVGKEAFPPSIDYVALGHLHVPQQVGNAAHIRYCGSPIPMGFGEAKQDKKVLLVTFNRNVPHIRALSVPRFQELARIVGSLDDILFKIETLKQKNSSAWLEIEFTGSDRILSLREALDAAVKDSAMEIRRIKNRQVMDRAMTSVHEDETLDDLGVEEVFARCLHAFEIPDDARDELMASYNEIIKDVMEEDVNEF